MTGRIFVLIAAAAALAIAGCAGDDGTIGVQGPQGDEGPIGPEGPAGPAGSGSDGATGPAGPTGDTGAASATALRTLEEAFLDGGTWIVVPKNTAGEAVTALSYDADDDDWEVTVAAGTFDLTNLLTNGTYARLCSPQSQAPCVRFTPFDLPNQEGGQNQYGTFAKVVVTTPTTISTGYTHFGFSTIDMPTTGSGSYSGPFEGIVSVGAFTDDLTGSVAVEASFTADGGSVSFVSSGTGLANGGAATYDLEGTAAIVGNDYSGALSVAEYFDGAGGNDPTDFTASAGDDTFSGEFYGNQTTETAGVVDANDGDDFLIGGYWADGNLSGQVVE